MPRKRMLSPEIWESESFGALDLLGKIVFIGMICQADDEGRGVLSASLLKSKLFPLNDELRIADVDNALLEIGQKTSTVYYEVEGKKYYFLTKWAKWQCINRPTPSKFPPPPRNGVRGDIHSHGALTEHSLNTHGALTEYSRPIERNRIEMNKRESQEREKGVGAPALTEVIAYFNEKTYKSDPKKFFAYYDVRDWLLDGKLVRKWQSLADLWESREGEYSPVSGTQNKYSDEELNNMYSHVIVDDE